MAATDFHLTNEELDGLARLCGRAADELRGELRQRPWALHDLLAERRVVDAVFASEPESLFDTPSPFVLFAVAARQAANDLLTGTHVNDWVGPRSRLPVFDVEALQEFVIAPGRVLFVARLLTSMVAPARLAVPIPTNDPWELVDWLDAVDERDRVVLLRRLGDLSLFLAGMQADAHGSELLTPAQARKVGLHLGMTSDEVLALIDPGSISPGLDTLEELGARWYREAGRVEPASPPILGDIAQRIHAARRFLTHLADTYIAPFEGFFPRAA